jgi:hypothetical protein
MASGGDGERRGTCARNATRTAPLSCTRENRSDQITGVCCVSKWTACAPHADAHARAAARAPHADAHARAALAEQPVAAERRWWCRGRPMRWPAKKQGRQSLSRESRASTAQTTRGECRSAHKLLIRANRAAANVPGSVASPRPLRSPAARPRRAARREKLQQLARVRTWRWCGLAVARVRRAWRSLGTESGVDKSVGGRRWLCQAHG